MRWRRCHRWDWNQPPSFFKKKRRLFWRSWILPFSAPLFGFRLTPSANCPIILCQLPFSRYPSYKYPSPKAHGKCYPAFEPRKRNWTKKRDVLHLDQLYRLDGALRSFWPMRDLAFVLKFLFEKHWLVLLITNFVLIETDHRSQISWVRAQKWWHSDGSHGTLVHSPLHFGLGHIILFWSYSSISFISCDLWLSSRLQAEIRLMKRNPKNLAKNLLLAFV